MQIFVIVAHRAFDARRECISCTGMPRFTIGAVSVTVFSHSLTPFHLPILFTHNSTHRYLCRGDFPLVGDLPTRGDASLAHQNHPPAFTRVPVPVWLFGIAGVTACECVETIPQPGLDRGEHPPFLVGPAAEASLLISVVARATTIIPCISRQRYPKWRLFREFPRSPLFPSGLERFER